MTQVRYGEIFPEFPKFLVSSEDTLVDVGCGSGAPCVEAGKLGAAVIAVDIDPQAVRLLREKMASVPARSFQALVSDSNPLPLDDGVATVVIATEVMEHVDDPRGFLSELVRIGKPGAHYFISVPDPVSEELMRIVSSPSYFQKPGHRRIFQHGQLDRLVKLSGLRAYDKLSSGFYWSMWWTLRNSVGSDHPPDSRLPPPNIVADWENIWKALAATANGPQLMKALDQIIPKSQVIMAQKITGWTWKVRARLSAGRSKLRELCLNGN
jgi:SAM-dependent methyltransferase